MSYFANYQHIVFRTLDSSPTIPEEYKREMLGYIYSISEEMGVTILRINSHLNHIHIFANIPPKYSISEYVKTVKAKSSKAFQGHPGFPFFRGWARKFGSFSKSETDKDMIINYIKGQAEHHRYKTFREELEEFFGPEFFLNAQNRHDWLDEPLPEAPSAKAD